MQIQHVRSITVRRIAYGASLGVLFSIMTIGIALLGTRYTSAPVTRIPAARPAQSVPLGVPWPAGADVRELPRGYSDYFLPESGNTAAKPPSMQLGIARPAGVEVRTLPSGYSDYFLPESASSTIPARSVQLGIARPAGVEVRTLPSGYSDYFLPNE